MSKSTIRKTYKTLCSEHEAIIDEVEDWKQGRKSDHEIRIMKLWSGSNYLDELFYIRMRIVKEMIPHEIVFRMKLYKSLNNNIHIDIINNIVSFLGLIDKIALHLINKGIDSTLDNVDSFYPELYDRFSGLFSL